MCKKIIKRRKGTGSVPAFVWQVLRELKHAKKKRRLKSRSRFRWITRSGRRIEANGSSLISFPIRKSAEKRTKMLCPQIFFQTNKLKLLGSRPWRTKPLGLWDPRDRWYDFRKWRDISKKIWRKKHPLTFYKLHIITKKGKIRRRRIKRKRYTLKQKPLLRQFLLFAPWRRRKYWLRREAGRIQTHLSAFCMYYRKVTNRQRPEYSCVRLIKKLRHKPRRVHGLFKKFEYRVDTTLVRLGWAPDIRRARDWVNSGAIAVKGDFVGSSYKTPILPDHILRSGERIFVLKKGLIARHIRSECYKRAWRTSARTLAPALKRPRGFNPRLFRKYKQHKRRFLWSRFFQLFFNHPSAFTVNYNSLVAIFRPNQDIPLRGVRYPRLLGPSLIFWEDAMQKN